MVLYDLPSRSEESVHIMAGLYASGEPVSVFREHARAAGPRHRLGLPNCYRQAMPGEPGHNSDGTTVRALPQGWWIGGRVLAKPACRCARLTGMSLRAGAAAGSAGCGLQ